MKHIIIIGTGLAGYMTAKEFRKINKTDRLTIITKDDGSFYSKPLLSTALTQNKTPEQLPVNSVEEMRLQLDAAIYTHANVQQINAAQKMMIFDTQDGVNETLVYDDLVLANGADKISVPLQGDAVTDLVSVNNLQDYQTFCDQLKDKQHVAILGSGFVGCEFANDLLNTGHQVTVISPDAYPLMRLVPEKIGLFLQKIFEKKGVKWRLSHFAKAVDHGYKVALSNDTVVNADLVLSAVGIRPATQLAKQAGLAVNQGVVVDQQLRTSDSHIYAIGDCAEVQGALKMYVAPILQGAKVLAKVLSGEDAGLCYPIMPIVIKTSNCPVVVVPSEPGVSGEWQYEETETGVKALFRTPDQQLAGFALAGDFMKERMALVKQMGA